MLVFIQKTFCDLFLLVFFFFFFFFVCVCFALLFRNGKREERLGGEVKGKTHGL